MRVFMAIHLLSAGCRRLSKLVSVSENSCDLLVEVIVIIYHALHTKLQTASAILQSPCFLLFDVGCYHLPLPTPRRAVNYLEDFQSISTELDDLEGQGRAYEALAAVYQVRMEGTGWGERVARGRSIFFIS